jgi:hypothetical protein
MAGLTGPGFSLSASGQLGKTVVFGAWKGRAYLRAYVSPANPKSAKQVGIRSMFMFLSQAWASLTVGEKASYDTLAASRNVSAFNVYMSINMALWRENSMPSKDIARAQAHTATTVATLVTTGGTKNVAISGTITSGTNMWAVVIYRATAEITVPSWTNVVAVIPTAGGTTFTLVDSPLDAGTYHYRAAAISDDGLQGTVKADQTATVTA